MLKSDGKKSFLVQTLVNIANNKINLFTVNKQKEGP